MHIYEELSSLFQGELDTSKETLETYSHDASLFELKPAVVARPKDVRDIQSVVSWVLKNKEKHPELSITPRSAGTDMSGGAIGQSIVLDMTAHFNEVTKLSRESARVQPGTYYRDFDKKTIDLGVMLPSYPAS
ncbi:TPA: FAD-binding oxidoreductase, partial [Candidatus Saccharibacteria bacterium]|nr:FAD-binding oxidoreductase [Candidatus Saccharibacteria bacterium]